MESLRSVLWCSLLGALLAVVAACGGGGDGADPPASASPAPDTLEGRLASVLLREEEVPAALEGGGLAFSTNEQVAGPNEEELNRLNSLGRLLGVDLTYFPAGDLPPDEPVRGGIQNSASVYSSAEGASASFRETEAEARATDWKPLYTDLTDVTVREVDIPIGDESYWFRVTGFEECIIEPAGSATPDPGLPSATCPPARLVVDDNVIFRAGRVRVLIKVVSAHPLSSSPDVFQEQVKGWADLVAARALETFPVPGR